MPSLSVTTYTKHLQKFCFNNDRDRAQNLSLWIDGFAQWQKQENPFGYKDTTLGATIGVDYSIRNWVCGIGLQYHIRSLSLETLGRQSQS